MATNKYAAGCTLCGNDVSPGAGTLSKVGRRWVVRHLACAAGAPAVDTVRFNSGRSYYRNRGGRCEDAPCCGCCTI